MWNDGLYMGEGAVEADISSRGEGIVGPAAPNGIDGMMTALESK